VPHPDFHEIIVRPFSTPITQCLFPGSVLQRCQQRSRIYISIGKNYICFIPKAWDKEILQAGEE
jgi:hypothetical protein